MESMYKASIFALKEEKEKILSKLHSAGVIQIIDLKAEDLPIEHSQPDNHHRESADLLLRISRLRNIMLMAPAKLTFPQSMFGLDLPDKHKAERKQDEKVSKDARAYIKLHEKTLLDLEQEIISSNEREEQINDILISLNQLSAFDVPLSSLRSTNMIGIITGRITTASLNTLKEEMNKELHGYVDILSKDIDAKTSLIAVISFKEDINKASFTAKKYGLAVINVPDIEGSDPIKAAHSELKEIKKNKQKAISDIGKIRKVAFPEAVLLREELELIKDKTEAIHKMRESERFFVMQGWVPESGLDFVKSINNTYVTLEDAPITEEVPVKLNNSKWLKPFEMLTELYSPPKYKDLDPTFIVGPIFLLFAGFMLTDFIYGLGLVLLAVVLMKFGKYSKGLKDISISIFGIGAVSMFFGVLTGSYLGDLPKYLIGMETAELAIWRDPLADPLYFLIISIIVALFHVNFGLILGSIEDFRKKDYKTFVSSRLIWWILQVGIAGFALASKFPEFAVALGWVGKIGLGAAVLIKLIANGPLGLLDMTGFMGDVISYSRLFALALSTAGIAMTVNLLTGLLWPLPYGIGIVAGLLIFIAGHLFSFAMNSLGGFVHSIRLQFVEFFGKFYEGGGNKFEPFKEERTYTEVDE